MSLSPNEKYPGATEADPNYKDSKFKDNNPSTTNNGSPLKALDRNEQLALQEAMMNAAGFDYNGVVDTPQNSQMFNAYKAALSNGANLLSNHNFLIPSPDDSQPAPSATPTSYPPGYEIFSGVFANETTGILNLTYIDGRVSFSGGDFYIPRANSKELENITEFVASVADFDGKPRTRGVSFALVGDEYRVTVGVDALEDESANTTPLGSVKFEQGSVATGHEVGVFQHSKIPNLSLIKNIHINDGSNFLFIDGFSKSGDGGDCVWLRKGFDRSKSGNSLDLSLMEAYDAVGNIYEPYGVYGTQKLEIKPNAIGAIGNFLNGEGKDNILELEALRDYLIRKGGGEIILDRFNVYGVSRSFIMGTSRNDLVHYQGDLTSGFGKLDGFVASPASGAVLDSVVRMNSNDFTDSVGTFEGWQCSSFIVQGMNGSGDEVTCMSVVGATRTSTIDNILTFGGYDGLALTSCWSHIFTRNRSENAHRKAHVMGSGEYGVIGDVVVNASIYQGNTGRGAGDWGLHWLFGSANGCSGNTYELNDKNAWFQSISNGAISNLYVEASQNPTDKIDLKIGGTDSELGVVQNVSFDGVIAAFGGGKVLLSGVQNCEIKNFRLDPSIPITSNGGARVINNKMVNARHDSTIDKSRNETDTFIKGVTNSSVKLARFSSENRTIIEYAVGADVSNGVTSVILSGFKAVGGRVFGFNAADGTESFVDEIDAVAFHAVTASEKESRGTPPVRNYSVSGENLTLNIAADYEIYIVADGVLFI